MKQKKEKYQRSISSDIQELVTILEDFTISLLGDNPCMTKASFFEKMVSDERIIAKALSIFGGYKSYIGYNLDSVLKKSKKIAIINIEKNIKDGVLNLEQYKEISKRAKWFIGYYKNVYRIRMIDSINETNNQLLML